MSRSGGRPKVLILRMAGVPLIDLTGAAALNRFTIAAAAKGTSIIFCELKPGPEAALREMEITALRTPGFTEALAAARAMIA